MFKKKTIRDIDVSEKKVLVRVDFNVPISDGTVSDDTRIKAALPTINYLMEKNSKVILCSHLGRPGGTYTGKYSLEPLVPILSELLGKPVGFANDCIGADTENLVNSMSLGDVLLLENTRFHAG